MSMVENYTHTPDREIAGSMPLYSESETIASGANLPRLTMVGRITASSKLIRSVRTANDGSQVPVGFTVTAVDAAAADVVAPVYKAGVFDFGALSIDVSWSQAQAKAALDRTPLFMRTPLSY